MSSFFRAPAPPPPKPTREQQLTRIRIDLGALERQRATLQAVVDRGRADAQRYAAAGQKEAARDQLRLAAGHETKLKHVVALHTNLSQQLSAIEVAATTASVATSMRAGAAVIADVSTEMDADALHRDLVDMRENTRRIDTATRLMTRPLYGDAAAVDDADIDDELAAMMAAATTAAPTEPSVESQPHVPVAERSIRDIESEMGLL